MTVSWVTIMFYYFYIRTQSVTITWMMDKLYYVSYKDSINCMLGDHYLLLTPHKDYISDYHLDDGQMLLSL